jgi:hypothetical protein
MILKILKESHPLACWTAESCLPGPHLYLQDLLNKSVIQPIQSVIFQDLSGLSRLKRLAVLESRFEEAKEYIGKEALSTDFSFLDDLESRDLQQLTRMLRKQDAGNLNIFIHGYYDTHRIEPQSIDNLY